MTLPSDSFSRPAWATCDALLEHFLLGSASPGAWYGNDFFVVSLILFVVLAGSFDFVGEQWLVPVQN